MCFMRMRHAASHLDSKIFEHPFNKELHLGTLPKPIFRLFLEQDALYLTDLANALELIAKRTPIDKHAKQLNLFSENIYRAQKNLHFNYLGQSQSPGFFNSNKSIEKIPVISDYTHYLIKTAMHSPLEIAIASLIPCFWIYSQLGKKMAENPIQANPYHAWISSYSRPNFILSGVLLISIMEELGDAITCPIKQANMVSAFVTSTKFELAFWDEVYQIHANQPELRSRLSH